MTANEAALTRKLSPNVSSLPYRLSFVPTATINASPLVHMKGVRHEAVKFWWKPIQVHPDVPATPAATPITMATVHESFPTSFVLVVGCPRVASIRLLADHGGVTDDDVFDAVRVLVNDPRRRVSPAPASPQAVSAAEDAVGASFPPLLRRLYLEVANGGFGPSGGILGVGGGPLEGPWADSIVDVLQMFRSGPEQHRTPVGVAPLLNWGCALWSLLDCRDSVGRMWGWDYDSDPTRPLFVEPLTLTEWFAAWLDSRLSWPMSPAYPTGGLRWGPDGEVR